LTLKKPIRSYVTHTHQHSKVGGGLETTFAQSDHIKAMMSLDNVFDVDEFRAWTERVLKEVDDPTWLCELKIDGLAINLLYEAGKLTKALTRGNGKTGEDVTLNVKTISGVPHQHLWREDSYAYRDSRRSLFSNRAI